jgi:hypothetical protein
METPGVAPHPGMTFGRDLGCNATQIRRRGGFIQAQNRIRARIQRPARSSGGAIWGLAFAVFLEWEDERLQPDEVRWGCNRHAARRFLDASGRNHSRHERLEVHLGRKPAGLAFAFGFWSLGQFSIVRASVRFARKANGCRAYWAHNLRPGSRRKP